MRYKIQNNIDTYHGWPDIHILYPYDGKPIFFSNPTVKICSRGRPYDKKKNIMFIYPQITQLLPLRARDDIIIVSWLHIYLHMCIGIITFYCLIAFTHINTNIHMQTEYIQHTLK